MGIGFGEYGRLGLAEPAEGLARHLQVPDAHGLVVTSGDCEGAVTSLDSRRSAAKRPQRRLKPITIYHCNQKFGGLHLVACGPAFCPMAYFMAHGLHLMAHDLYTMVYGVRRMAHGAFGGADERIGSRRATKGRTLRHRHRVPD